MPVAPKTQPYTAGNEEEAAKWERTQQYNEMRVRMQQGLMTREQGDHYLRLEQEAIQSGLIYPPPALSEGRAETPPHMEMTPILGEAESIGAGAESAGIAGSTAGDILGGIAANLLPGGGAVKRTVKSLARIGLPAAGAAAGYTVHRSLEGVPDPSKGAEWEALMTGLPNAAQEFLKNSTLGFLKRSWGGQIQRHDFAAREALRSKSNIFDPPDKRIVSGAYDRVYDSKMPVYFDNPNTTLERFKNSIDRRDHGYLNRKLAGADQETRNTFNILMYGMIDPKNPNTHVRYQALPIERIDKLRQYLNKHWKDNPTSDINDLMADFRSSVDDLVDSSLTDPRTADRLAKRRGVSPDRVANDLEQARRDHFLRVSDEKFDALLNQHSIIKMRGKDARFWEMNLSNLETLMQGDHQGKLAQEIKRRMEQTPGAWDAYNGMIKRLRRQFMKIEGSAPTGRHVGDVVARFTAKIMMSPMGQMLFEDAVTQGRGKLSFNVLAQIYNAVRRGDESGKRGEEISQIGSAIRGAMPLTKKEKALPPPPPPKEGETPSTFGTFQPLGN